jgi:hypothetical protein
LLAEAVAVVQEEHVRAGDVAWGGRRRPHAERMAERDGEDERVAADDGMLDVAEVGGGDQRRVGPPA